MPSKLLPSINDFRETFGKGQKGDKRISAAIRFFFVSFVCDLNDGMGDDVENIILRVGWMGTEDFF